MVPSHQDLGSCVRQAEPHKSPAHQHGRGQQDGDGFGDAHQGAEDEVAQHGRCFAECIQEAEACCPVGGENQGQGLGMIPGCQCQTHSSCTELCAVLRRKHLLASQGQQSPAVAPVCSCCLQWAHLVSLWILILTLGPNSSQTAREGISGSKRSLFSCPSGTERKDLIPKLILPHWNLLLRRKAGGAPIVPCPRVGEGGSLALIPGGKREDQQILTEGLLRWGVA